MIEAANQPTTRDCAAPGDPLDDGPPLRVAMLLSGIGRVQRGAEAAFLEIARCLARRPRVQVTLFGSGDAAIPSGTLSHNIGCRPRERFEHWPRVPCFRGEGMYEEFSFTRRLAKSGLYRPADHDIAMHCTYPWVNWHLQRTGRRGGPLNVYVTQNGDWPCQARHREYRHFACDGLVCTNPEYYERNRQRYPSALIPNGVDPDRFLPRDLVPNVPTEQAFDFDAGGRPVVLMVSALIPSKDVAGGIQALAQVPEPYLVVAGDGPQRQRVTQLAAQLLPGRHTLLGSLPRDRMPALFRQADVFLHMSRDEPFGLVYLEAASSGLPQVVHDTPVTRWTLGETAQYTNADSADEVAQALRAALDPERARRLGTMGRQRVLEGWSWQAVSTRYLAFFNAIRANSYILEPSSLQKATE